MALVGARADELHSGRGVVGFPQLIAPQVENPENSNGCWICSMAAMQMEVWADTCLPAILLPLPSAYLMPCGRHSDRSPPCSHAHVCYLQEVAKHRESFAVSSSESRFFVEAIHLCTLWRLHVKSLACSELFTTIPSWPFPFRSQMSAELGKRRLHDPHVRIELVLTFSCPSIVVVPSIRWIGWV